MAVSSTGTSLLVSSDLEARTIAWRRHLHANSELSSPAAFFWVGPGNEELGTTWPHHHPRFDIDEVALKHGTAVFVRTALDVLA